MAMLLKGAEVAKTLTEELHAKTEELKANGVEPCLAILRVGAREDDLAYERGALKRCEKAGVLVRQVILPEDVQRMALPVLCHRVMLSPEARMKADTPDRIVSSIIDGVQVPVRVK